MKENFQTALKKVLKWEGGYVNHPKDPGGPTNLGITIYTARRLGIDVDGDNDTDIVDIKLLTVKEAAIVYRAEYWDKINGDKLPSGLDYAVFDYAVNSGWSRAAIALQRVIGGIADDGIIGNETLKAVRKNDTKVLIDRLVAERMSFLTKLKNWPTFGRGWAKRVSGTLRDAIKMAG